MKYSELFAVTDLLNEIRKNREVKIHPNTRVDLTAVENLFRNILADIDKKKVKSNEEIVYYRLGIEVKK